VEDHVQTIFRRIARRVGYGGGKSFKRPERY
jgi:hypothetical protein